MRVLIVGCGYVGLPLGAELMKQGHEVFGIRRSKGGEAELRAASIQPLIADITKPEELAKLPAPFDWVVNCVSSNQGGVEEYRQVYLNGTRNLIEWLASAPPRKFAGRIQDFCKDRAFGNTPPLSTTVEIGDQG